MFQTISGRNISIHIKGLVKAVEKIKNLYEKNKEIISYLIFGILTTLVNFIVYYITATVLGVDPVIGNIIAWFISVLFAYITNRIFVFRSERNGFKGILSEMAAFFLARIASAVFCDVGTFALMVKVFGINDYISKIVTQVMVVIMNYVLSKLVIFRKK